MSGHNKWTQIKRKKEITDKKRSQMFSKLLRAISVTAQNDPNPLTNSSLRAAIDRARENNVPQDNIDRSIKRSSETKNLERLILEGYGPDGVAIIVTATTNSKNRTVAEIKKIITDHHGKWADPGSVLWAFTKTDGGWEAKFPQSISKEAMNDLIELVNALDDHDDVDDIYTTAQMESHNE
jgi:YebC/PmpR family DNA-binding regulatory protein